MRDFDQFGIGIDHQRCRMPPGPGSESVAREIHVMVMIAAGCSSLLLTAAALAQDLSGTLNFENVTATRVVSVVAEVASNEKALDTGDFDNDGDLDVVIANAHSDFGARKNKLYRNDAGVLQEVSPQLIPGFANADVSRSAFFRDYNLDGWLDICILNGGNTGGQGGTDKLYLNEHIDGQVTGFLQVNLPTSPLSPENGGDSRDFDEDGDDDLYKGNSPNNTQDYLWLNDGEATFALAIGPVPLDSDYTQDVASADMNGDGTLDIIITNWTNQDSYIYYNNLNGMGSDLGDFSYPGSTQPIGIAQYGTTSIEPGDLDGDGDFDLYWTNRDAGYDDRVLLNTGNDKTGRALLTVFGTLPLSVLLHAGTKSEISDLNGDGRNDVVVFKEDIVLGNSRPTILRNTTVEGELSFVDWTPATSFPSGQVHKAWHGALLDSNNDGDIDIMIGGYNGDHLFEQVPTPTIDESQLPGGVISNLLNSQPLAVLGSAPVAGGAPDEYIITGLIDDTRLAIVLNGPDDHELTLTDADRNELAVVNRGGLGVEEAIQFEPAPTFPAEVHVIVRVIESAPPPPQPADLDENGDVGASDLAILLAAWGSARDHPADFNDSGFVGVEDLAQLLASWGPVVNQYQLELLARTG
jgi:hypothetical protein